MNVVNLIHIEDCLLKFSCEHHTFLTCKHESFRVITSLPHSIQHMKNKKRDTRHLHITKNILFFTPSLSTNPSLLISSIHDCHCHCLSVCIIYPGLSLFLYSSHFQFKNVAIFHIPFHTVHRFLTN